MNIVCEGPDGAGKSTLAEALSRSTGMVVQQGSGPPREPGEIERRLLSYLALDGVIFDRHPAVSQPIYGSLRGEKSSDEFIGLCGLFYSTRPLVIYCRSTSVDRHVVKEGENLEHVRALTERYFELVAAYDRWAASRAHLLYRIDDDPLSVVDVVGHVLRRMRASS